MNNFLKVVIACVIVTFSITHLNAQVTIGASDAPVNGALLDLKQEDNSSGGPTAKLGLGLPRVKLTDKDNLFPMFTGDDDYTGTYKQDQDLLHVGLLVYNVDACSLSGKGMYVWTKNGWEILGNATGGGGLNVSPSNLFFYNGLSNTENVTASFTGTGPLTMTEDKTGGLNFTVTATGTTSPKVYSVTVPEMTFSELEVNPFLLKKGKMAFELSNSPCGDGGVETKSVDIQQINKALVLGENSIYTNDGTKSGSVTVKSNAQWKMEGILPTLNPIEIVTVLATNDLKSGATINWENDLGEQGGSGNISVTVGTENSNRYNYITLTDATNPKRFSDITLAVLQCGSTNNPSMDEWVKMAGLEGVPKDTSNANGTQWHTDQDGNIFLSGKFGNWIKDDGTVGSERRWMITNLAAKTFAPEGTRTGDDKKIVLPWGSAYVPYNGSIVTNQPFPSANGGTTTGPIWCYPSGNGTTDEGYKANPRNGLMYNWSAATNSLTYQDFSKSTTGFITPEVSKTTRFDGYNKRQGICPNGWHLPSFSETLDFLNEIYANSSSYSSSPDKSVASGPIAYLNETFNSVNTKLNLTKLGVPLKDYCSINVNTVDLSKLKGVATSNPITSAQIPGFNAAFCGFGKDDIIQTPNQVAYYWLYSAENLATYSSNALYFTYGTESVNVSSQGAGMMLSVRCVQDYDAN